MTSLELKSSKLPRMVSLLIFDDQSDQVTGRTMSFAKSRIEEYLASKAFTEEIRTAVPFGEARMGDLEIVIVANDWHPSGYQSVSEEEIERRLADEGLIHLPAEIHQP